MATKEGEAPIHVNVPKSWVEDIDWAIRHENEKSGKFPKPTRTDVIKNAILRLVEDARVLRKEFELETAKKAEEALTKDKIKRLSELEAEAMSLLRSDNGKATRQTEKRLAEIRVEAERIRDDATEARIREESVVVKKATPKKARAKK